MVSKTDIAVECKGKTISWVYEFKTGDGQNFNRRLNV
jgi:hypothetical protein